MRTFSNQCQGKKLQGLLRGCDPQSRVDCVGGYRRGKAHSHDVDFLITVSPEVEGPDVLADLLDTLAIQNHLLFANATKHVAKTSLSVDERLSQRARSGEAERPDFGIDDLLTKLCIVRTPFTGKTRRIIATIDQHPFALLGWTGDKMYNREIRRWADGKGYHLSSSGLWDLRQPDALLSIPAATEREIIDVLKLPYLPPDLRNH